MEREKKGLIPDHIRSIRPYPPGKPIEELERELGIKGSIKLASNENPLGPSPKALEAIERALKGIHRYPDGGGYYLKKRLAELYDLEMDSIILGNGSNEIIELVVRTFLKSGEAILTGYPTFLVYELVVKAAGGRTILVPLKEMTYDLEAMAKRLDEGVRIVFIANPNNPTGTIVKRDELEAFLDHLPEDTILVLDEAYHEYVMDPDYPDGLRYLKKGKRVLVLRTFSKIYGLAGLRIGYGMGDRELIDGMNRVRQPFNVNSLAQIGALAAIDDREHIGRSVENNRRGLEFLYREVGALGLPYIPTQTNFFLIKVGDGDGVYRALLKKGVIVRSMGSYGLGEYIRVTVGLPEENERFIEALREIIT